MELWPNGASIRNAPMVQHHSDFYHECTSALRAFWRLLVAYTCIVDLRKAIYVKLQHTLSSLALPLSYFNANSTAIQPDISTTDGSLNHRQESKNWILCTQFSTWHKISNFITWIFKPPKLEHQFLRLWSSLFPRHLHLEKIISEKRIAGTNSHIILNGRWWKCFIASPLFCPQQPQLFSNKGQPAALDGFRLTRKLVKCLFAPQDWASLKQAGQRLKQPKHIKNSSILQWVSDFSNLSA